LQVHGQNDVFSSEKMSVTTMRRRIAEWVVFCSGPKGFARFPVEAWKDLPDELSWMRRLYVEDYLANELYLEPSVVLNVQGVPFSTLSLCHS
jgi:hypothetical protein